MSEQGPFAMVFWIVTAGVTLAVLATMARALLHGDAADRPPAAYDLDVYRDQLREVERDLARGVVSEADAERVRTEVSRRILAADAALQAHAAAPAGKTSLLLPGLLGLAVIGGAYLTYLQLGAPGYGDLALATRIDTAQSLRADRPGQAAAETSVTDAPPLAPQDPEFTALVTQLRTMIQDRQDDPEGLQLLSQAEARLGNFVAAHQAKAQVIALRGADATAADYSEYADLMVMAAGGYVSPEAEEMLERTLALDPRDGPARYYYGLMLSQTGRPDTALRIWDQLLREGPEDAPWVAAVLGQIETVALRAGVQYVVPQIGGTVLRGPTAEDIEAAQDMSPAEQMEMIQGMVSGLSDRLATEGGPVEDWARLISALGVLGQRDRAAAILAEARAVFDGDPTAADILRTVAERVNLE